MTAVQYIGDDGTTYQIEQPAAYSAPGAGNLPTAAGTEPLFPALYVPRFFHGIGFGVGSGQDVRVICDESNAIYKAGPGTTFLIVSTPYRVGKCQGEQRPFIFY
jgi:hypothetical protein